MHCYSKLHSQIARLYKISNCHYVNIIKRIEQKIIDNEKIRKRIKKEMNENNEMNDINMKKIARDPDTFQLIYTNWFEIGVLHDLGYELNKHEKDLINIESIILAQTILDELSSKISNLVCEYLLETLFKRDNSMVKTYLQIEKERKEIKEKKKE